MNSTPCDTKPLCQLKTHLSAKGADWAVIYQGAIAPWLAFGATTDALASPATGHWDTSPLPWSLRMYVCTFVNFYLQCTVHGHWAVIQTGSEQHTFFHTGCCIPSHFTFLFIIFM